MFKKVDPLEELEKDFDVRTAIADVERIKAKEAELRSKTRLRRFRDTLMEWGRFSTWDGVAHLALADSVFARVFWSSLVVASIVAFAYLMFITLARYLKFETNLSLDLDHGEFDFPSVTICNNSPYMLNKSVRKAGGRRKAR